MKISFALCAKSPFFNIHNSNLLIKHPFHNLIYILLHIYTLFHHPIEKLELQTLCGGGGNNFFQSLKGGSNIIFDCIRGGSGIFSHVLRLSAIWKPSLCCLVPYFVLQCLTMSYDILVCLTMSYYILACLTRLNLS